MIWIKNVEISSQFRKKALNFTIKSNTEVPSGYQFIKYKEAIDAESFIADIVRDIFISSNLPKFLQDGISNAKTFSVTRLEPGEYMNKHIDKQNEPDLNYVALLYITEKDNYEGREFYYELSNNIKIIKPKNGTVVIFDASLPHGVMPLITNVNITSFSFGIKNKS